MPTPVIYVIFGAVALVLCVIGFFAGSAFRRISAEKTIGSAETEA